MTSSQEEFYLNNLDFSLERSWELLTSGKKDRNSPLHTLAVGTVTADGSPSQRIMVLRDVNREKRLLRFNTDARVSKVADLDNSGAISILGYHPDAKVQLRLSGTARIEREGAIADAAWEQASPYGKRCYLAEPAPGSPVDAPTSGLDPAIEGQKPDAKQTAPARSNFAVLLAEINRIEWLYLAHTGHRRALFCWNEKTDQWESGWLVP